MPRVPRWSVPERTSKLFAWLDGTLDISDLAAFCGVTADEVEQTLAPLVAAGLVGFGEETAAPARPDSEAPPAAGGARLELLGEEEKRRINDTYAKLAKTDHYALLGV
ncbi:MAG TPA: hypothetical protein VIF62_15885, partial [Labilithrix sp.]